MAIAGQEKERVSSIRVAILGIVLLALVTMIVMVSLQPVSSGIVRAILIYVFIFLGSGLLAAALINLIMDKKDSEKTAL